MGITVPRERVGEHSAEIEFVEKMCLERNWGTTVLRERLGNTVLRERLGEHCAERDIGGKLC